MTRALGKGTVNLTVNVRRGVRRALGRAAFGLDVSMGEFCRRLFCAGVRFVVLVRTARAAEAADQAALTRLRSAQLPNSPGGLMITVEEARAIEQQIRVSAVADAQIASTTFRQLETA